jgi:hypothetical protein
MVSVMAALKRDCGNNISANGLCMYEPMNTLFENKTYVVD